MRILQLIKCFDVGGAENHVCDLSNALRENGNNVFIIGKPGRQLEKLSRDVHFIPIRFRRLFLPFNLLFLVHHIRRNQIQVIHAHQRHSIFLAALAGKLSHTPVVVTVHGRSQYDLSSRFSRRYANQIIFVSQFVRSASVRFPEIQQKTVYIPNGIHVKYSSTSRKQHQICYISRVDKKHGALISLIIQKVLPTLLLRHPEITFRIVGEGCYSEQIKLESERLNQNFKREICIISGYQSNVCELIQKSALVMGVGRVALEALACGTPIFSINKNRMGTIVSSQNYEFYKTNNFVCVGNLPPSAESILNELNDFFTRRSYWQNETELLRFKVEDDFNITAMTDQIESVYEGLLNS